MADGEEIQAEEAEENKECADGAGDDRAGNVELEVDEQAAEDKQENGDVGVGEFAEQAFALGGSGGDDRCPLEMQGLGGAVEAMDLAAIESLKQGVVVECDQIDEL